MAETESPSYVVFTYGTLKRGEPNYRQMDNQEGRFAEFLGCGETAEKYPLVVHSAYNVPFLMKVEGQGHNVKGELYRVNEEMLKHLDIFEFHPQLYLRQEATISVTEDKDDKGIVPPESKKCWVYFLSKAKDEMLKLKYLSEYKSESKEHAPYLPRMERDSSVSLMDMIFPPS